MEAGPVAYSPGILVQLGVGVGLGTALLRTGAAGWRATFVVSELGVEQTSEFAILAVLRLFMIVARLGFSGGAAMATTIIPVMISVLQEAQIPTPKVAGMIMLLTDATSIGWILPIIGPQNTLAFGADTFEAHDFVRVGLVITAVAYASSRRCRSASMRRTPWQSRCQGDDQQSMACVRA